MNIFNLKCTPILELQFWVVFCLFVFCFHFINIFNATLLQNCNSNGAQNAVGLYTSIRFGRLACDFRSVTHVIHCIKLIILVAAIAKYDMPLSKYAQPGEAILTNPYSLSMHGQLQV